MTKTDKLAQLYKKANGCNEECSIEFCDSKKYAKGYCKRHYVNLWKYDDPLFYKGRKNPSKKIDFYENDNGCFICTSHVLDKDGYATITHDFKQTKVHRFVYTQMFGEIPKGSVIRHKCDNPSCINPEHLEVGTYKENTQDMMDRGRHKPNRKFNQQQLSEIKQRIAEGIKLKDIAKVYHVHPSTISNIKRGVCY